MELLHHKAGPEQFITGLSMLKAAAEAIRAKGSDQWNIWLDPNESQVQWIRDGFANGEFYFVENSHSQIMGMYRLSDEDLLYWGKMPDRAAYLHSLIVKKEFSGNDIGKTIMGQLEEALLNNGMSLLRLDCNAGNAWLCNYYERMGFECVGQKQMPHSLNNLYEKSLY